MTATKQNITYHLVDSTRLSIDHQFPGNLVTLLM
ncbi:hypothetical protein AFE_2441 [Acidithiobacillus ferrooxidans ATCC 23270]|uniref:Uncharacterized protein n=1 Tax=Acidithiobacillus ferrooxidans (strain ATCC 23270 / DSM 14882 / CIP 104768 / NCIMB 8455) TaxID=243159 RepID=B7J6Y0_ACIF2|nr:hypothetical protein AFE_2441 [Acidithiobacillus ferrooxidans ATCC 23270]